MTASRTKGSPPKRRRSAGPGSTHADTTALRMLASILVAGLSLAACARQTTSSGGVHRAASMPAPAVGGGDGPLARLPIEPAVGSLPAPSTTQVPHAGGSASAATPPVPASTRTTDAPPPTTSPPTTSPSTTSSPESTAATTPPGPPCETKELDGSGFVSDSWALPPTLIAQLPEVAAQPYIHIELVGHTDPRPTEIGNDALSYLRAEAVAWELERLGVPASFVAIDWVGAIVPSNPDHDDPADYAADRRVDLRAWCGP